MKKKITALGAVVLAICVCVTVVGIRGGSLKESNLSTVEADSYAGGFDFDFDPDDIITDIFGTTSNVTPSASEKPSTTTTTKNIGGEVSSRISDYIDDKEISQKFDDITGSGSVIGDAVSEFINSDSVSNIGNIGGSGGLFDGFDFGSISSGFSGLIDMIRGGNSAPATPATNAPSNNYAPLTPVVNLKTPSSTVKNAQSNQTTHGETVDYALANVPYDKPTGELKAGDKGDGVKWLQWIFVYTHYGLRDDGITGVLDEDTVAVVKKLQQQRGLTVDGVVNEDVIKAAEALLVSFKNTQTAPQTAPTLTGDSVTQPAAQANVGSSTAIVAMLIILAIIWIIAIALILFIVILRRKKKKSVRKEITPLEKAIESGSGEFNSAKQEPLPSAQAAEKDDSPAIKSLADLFEEAETKKDN